MALVYTLSLPCIIADSLAAAARVGDEAWLALMDWLFSTGMWGEPQKERETQKEREWGGGGSILHLVSTATPNNFSQTREMT